MITPTKKGEIYGKYKSGMSMFQLAKEAESFKPTIQGIIRKREMICIVKPAWNTCNGHILAFADENRMIRHVRKDPKQTCANLRDRWHECQYH
jgi:hypothetical protein